MYPCPSCGFLMFSTPPGSDEEICDICLWQDDASSLRFATIPDGPNKVSLIEAQKNFAAYGAAEPRLRAQARAPTPADRREPGWRPIDPKIDVFENPHSGSATRWPDDTTTLYYWRPNYWLKPQG